MRFLAVVTLFTLMACSHSATSLTSSDADSTAAPDDDDDATSDAPTEATTTTTTATDPSTDAGTSNSCDMTKAVGTYALADPTWDSGSESCMGTSYVPYLGSPIQIAQNSDGSFTMTDANGYVTPLTATSTCLFTGEQKASQGGEDYITTFDISGSNGGVKIIDDTSVDGTCHAKATVTGTKS